MITLITGDLFTTPDLDALAQGVNCAGKMGKGIAVEFKKRWPGMFHAYAGLCAKGELFPGNIFSYRAGDGPWIYCLATQWKPGPCATLGAVWASTRALVRSAEQRGLRRVGMPRIGTWLGGLEWVEVLPLLTRAAEGSAVELVVVTLPEAR